MINNHTPILLVSRDGDKADLLTDRLGEAGFTTTTAESVFSVWHRVVQETPFAIILDATANDSVWVWNLCRDLAEGTNALIVMLVASEGEGTNAEALSCGADQCLAASPANYQTLITFLNRQEARLAYFEQKGRRDGEGQESELEVDLANRRVLRNGSTIRLTRRECAFIELLASQPDQPMPTEEISRTLWESKGQASGYGLVKQYVGRLRRKIEPDPERPIHLETVRSIGYCLHPKGRLPKADGQAG